MDGKNLAQVHQSWMVLEQRLPGMAGFERCEPLMKAALAVRPWLALVGLFRLAARSSPASCPS